MKDRMFFIFMGLAALWTIIALVHVEPSSELHRSAVFVGSSITAGFCFLAAGLVYAAQLIRDK